MSKNIKSVALSIAGIMIAAPAGAEIASTDYVDRVVGETHIQGSVLQFGKLTDDPAFILGATGTGVSNYGAVSIAELGLTLGSQIAGSAITGFATGSGSFVLVGDGTTSGSAMWSSVTEMLRNGLDTTPSTSIDSALVHHPGRNTFLYMTPVDFTAVMVKGSRISGYGTGTGSYVLVGSTTTGIAKWQGMSTMGPSIAGYGTMAASGISHVLVGSSATGTASWATVNDLATKIQGARITGFLPYGQAASSGGLGTGATISASGGSYVLAGASGASTDVAGWRNIADVLEAVPTGSGNLVLIRNSLDTAGDGDNIYWTGVTGISKMVRGSSITGYGTGTGNYVLVGGGTATGSAGWRGMSTMGGAIAGYGAGTGSFVLVGLAANAPAHYTNASNLSQYMQGSAISGYGTGTGSYVLVGDGTTTGTAKWQGMSTMGPSIAGYGTGTGNYVLVGDGATTGSAKWQHMLTMGSSIAGYGPSTGGSFVLVGRATGDTAKWSTVTEMLRKGLGATPPTDNFSVPVHYHGINNFVYVTPEAFTARMIVGSAIARYNTVTGQPSYILGSSASGTDAKPALYPMSGLGSKIEFTETKTAAQLSASTGTIYFPVIQGGKIYGVTLNDFYILMNAQF